MSRVRYGVARRKKHNRVLKKAKGFWGGRHRLYRTAKDAVVRSEVYSTVGRRDRKGDFRQLWIRRISAACATREISYNKLIHGLKKAEIILNRKMLAEIAVRSPESFTRLVELARRAG